MITLAQAKQFCAPWVDVSGVNPNDPRVVNRINEAQELLGPKGDNDDQIRTLRFCSYGDTITLGRDIKKIIKYRIDGEMEHVWSKWYEFLENGPGPFINNAMGHKDCLDRGMVVTQYDPPSAMRVLVASDEVEEDDVVITVRGYDDNDQEIRWNGSFGEAIPIRKDNCAYSASSFKTITNIVKPVTNGYVHLMAVPATGAFYQYHLCSYHPDETNPSYRRYQITAPADGYGHLITALVKLQLVPASHDSDVMYIQSLVALKRMIQGIAAYDAGDVEKGDKFERLAHSILMQKQEDVTPVNTEVEFQMEGFMDGTPTML